MRRNRDNVQDTDFGLLRLQQHRRRVHPAHGHRQPAGEAAGRGHHRPVPEPRPDGGEVRRQGGVADGAPGYFPLGERLRPAALGGREPAAGRHQQEEHPLLSGDPGPGPAAGMIKHCLRYTIIKAKKCLMAC